MAERALDGVGRRWALGEQQVAQLEALLSALASDEHAPTAVRDRRRAADVHIADSLSGLEVPALREAERIVDIGSGAGFPGLPLAIALPRAQFVLLESQRRRCRFIESVAAGLGLVNVAVVCARAESWEAGLGWADAATARALAAQPVVLEYAAPLLREGGVLVEWRAASDPAERAAAGVASRELGLEESAVLAVAPYPEARELRLHVFRKAHPTPARFPRRAGVARKRPLGG